MFSPKNSDFPTKNSDFPPLIPGGFCRSLTDVQGTSSAGRGSSRGSKVASHTGKRLFPWQGSLLVTHWDVHDESTKKYKQKHAGI